MKKRIISLSIIITILISIFSSVQVCASVNFTDKMKKDFALYAKIIPDFEESDITDPEFVHKFIRCAYVQPFFPGAYTHDFDTYKYGYNIWNESDIRRQYKLLFGVDMPSYYPSAPSTPGDVVYKDGKYWNGAGNYGDDEYVFESITERDDGFDVIYNVTDCDGTSWGNKIKCSAKYADNENGYVLTSRKWYNPIKVVLNNKTLTFPQDPVMVDDRVMVPIRQIAEAMGDKVLWNSDINAALIQHGDRALVIKLGADGITIADDENSFIGWDRKELDVPAQIIGGSTLVPLRAFCEALSADVDWNGEKQTVTIKYDTSSNSGKLSDEVLENINAVFYSLYADSEAKSFAKYSSDLSDFYKSTSKKKSAATIAFSDLENGVKTILDNYGNSIIAKDENTRDIIKSSLAAVLLELPDNPAVSFSADDALPLKDKIDSLNDVVSDFFAEKYPLVKTATDAMSISGKVIDWTGFSLEEITNIANNYSVNIAYLNALKDGCTDAYVKKIVKDMINEYTYKWVDSLYEISSKVSSEIIKDGTEEVLKDEIKDELKKNVKDAAADAVLGEITGLYDISLFATDCVNTLTGLDDLAKSICDFSGIMVCDNDIDSVYSRYTAELRNSLEGAAEDMNTAADNFKKIFELQKAEKTFAYKKIKEITNDSATKKLCDDYISEISNKTYIMWK